MDRTQTQGQSTQSQGQPPVIQDIFAQQDMDTSQVDVPLPTPHPQELQYRPISSQFGASTISAFPQGRRRRLPRWTIPVVSVFVILVVLTVVLVMLQSQNDSSGTTLTNTAQLNSSQPINTVHIQSVNTQNTTTVVDTDGDGLTNEEEAVARTDQKLIDTDSDGLTDREEIKVYATNPLNADTDGDRYLDGEEVRRLFNPKGPGKLFDVRDEINKAQTNSQQ